MSALFYFRIKKTALKSTALFTQKRLNFML